MIGKRLKQFRLAKGFSLDELVAATGGIVSKVSLSKYERDLMKPSHKVLAAISKALDVKSVNLAIQPNVRVEFIAYRKGSGLLKKDQANVESLIQSKLEDRINIQDILFPTSKPNLPIRDYEIGSFDEVESAAVSLRSKWKLGLDPISNITQILESNFVHVLFINSEKSFDGISALAYTSANQLKAAAVVSKSNIPGERQRLNLAHELGHIVLNISPKLDVEKVAFRFGAAFMAPSETILKVVGSRREHFQLQELFILKKIFGMSIQSLLFRLRDLGVISSSAFSNWYKVINRRNWKKDEPFSLPAENSHWFEKNVLHAFSEGLISSTDAARLLDQEINSQNLSLIRKKEFLKLPPSDREKILSAQADNFVQFYETNVEWKEFGGDIIEH